MIKRKRVELLERSQRSDLNMPLVVQELDETAEQAILRYQMAHPDEEEGKEYFLVQFVKSPQSGILADCVDNEHDSEGGPEHAAAG